MAATDGGGVVDKEGVNGMGVGGVLQGNCEIGVVIWEKKSGGGRFHDKSNRVMP